MHERRLQRAHGHAHARDNNIPSQSIPKSHQFIQMWAGKQDDLTTCKFVGGMRGGANYMLFFATQMLSMKSRVRKPKNDMIYGVRAANQFEIDGNFLKIFEVGEVIQKEV